jgi:hypothetical protein
MPRPRPRRSLSLIITPHLPILPHLIPTTSISTTHHLLPRLIPTPRSRRAAPLSALGTLLLPAAAAGNRLGDGVGGVLVGGAGREGDLGDDVDGQAADVGDLLAAGDGDEVAVAEDGD